VAETTGRARRIALAWWPLACALVALTLVLSACGPDASQAQAQHNRAQLDNELAHARQLGVPESTLQPIVSKENQVAAGQGGWGYSYSNAATNYALLYNQLVGVEQQSGTTLQQQATQNVNAFSSILNERKSQGFSETSAYEARLSKAFQDLGTAKTPSDYAAVSSFAQGQAEALTALWPAYQKLQVFRSSLDALQKVRIDTQWWQAQYNQDLDVFRAAASADRYQHLVQVIDGQIMEVVADQVQALPVVGGAMLDQFQAQIDALKSWGESTAAFQTEHDNDAKELASAKTVADYLTLQQVIDKQTQDMALPAIRGKARAELAQVNALINTLQAQNPLNVYEYADPSRGIGDVQGQFDQAASSSDPMTAYTDAEYRIFVFLNNLRAMQDNLSDQTPAWQPHASDLQLMSLYGLLSGQVTVVSLREQTARMYVNGKMVYWSYVTTGRYERPTPPGMHYAYWKQSPIEFLPSEPIGSPIRGNPTHINYAVYYADYGFFLHDAWWRLGFGPGSNLPHWDPAAFNGGSHGCINFPLQNMAWYYNWVQVGTPVLVY
jgi:L,D-transpeptidase catalytic domain